MTAIGPPVKFRDVRCHLLWWMSDALLLSKIAQFRPDILPPEEWTAAEAQLTAADALRWASDPGSENAALRWQAEPTQFVQREWNNFTNTIRWHAACDFLWPHLAGLTTPVRVLDFGCHTGANGIQLANCFPHVTAHLREREPDLEPAMRQTVTTFATDPSRVVVEIGDQFTLPLGTFGVIFAGEVLEHCFDWQRTIGAFEAACTPGARVVFTTPCGPWEGGKPEHVHVAHWEQDDLVDAFGHKTDFRMTRIVQVRMNAYSLGWNVFSWLVDGAPTHDVHWARKARRWGIEIGPMAPGLED